MEKTIPEVPFSRLPNSDHFNFHSEVKNLIESCEAGNINCQKEFELYKEAISNEIIIVKYQRGSAITPELDAIDKERGGLVTYAFTIFDAAEYSPVDSAKEAYALLLPVIKPFRGLNSRTNSQKTAEITALINDLRAPQNANSVSALNLNQTIDLLEFKNKEYMDKNEERLEQTPDNLNTYELRQATDNSYNIIKGRIIATLTLSTNDNAEKLADSLTALIKQVKHSYNLRMSHNKEDEEEDV